jgi:hypothetical protein
MYGVDDTLSVRPISSCPAAINPRPEPNDVLVEGEPMLKRIAAPNPLTSDEVLSSVKVDESVTIDVEIVGDVTSSQVLLGILIPY